MIFLIIATALVVVTIAILFAVPSRGETGTRRAEEDLAIYKDQLAELERDLARGVITEAEEKAARIEVERRLLAASRRMKTATGQHRSKALTLATLVLLALVPLGTWITYSQLGNPEMTDNPDADTIARQTLERAAENPASREIFRQLTSDLQQDTRDLEKWLQLGRALYSNGRKAEAIPAYETAVRLSRNEDPILFAEYTLVTLEVLEERIEANPDDIEAWRQLATIRMALGDINAGQSAYETVLQLDPQDEQARTALGVDAFSSQE